jgi:acetyltransferase-like isoleucine patch superfamily enzyme
MNSRGKSLKALVPDRLKQAIFRSRARRHGARIEFGPGSRIDSYTRFTGSASLNAGASVFGTRVGRWTYFGDRSLAIFSEIGAFCSIAAHVIIGGGRHPTSDYVTTSPLFYSERDNPWGSFGAGIDLDSELPLTTIGNDVWIGYAAVILPGVRVGDGAVIGAGAVVTRDVEPYGIVAGVPAKFLRSRFEPADVDWLLGIKWWDWPDEKLKQLRPQFAGIASLRAAIETGQVAVEAQR